MRTTEVRRADHGPPCAVLLNGTVGVGKTAVAEAVGAVLAQMQVPNAVIDVDWLRNAWPVPPDDRFTMGLALRNLSAVTRNYVEAGAARLVLAGVVETWSDRDAYEEALGIPLALCRLRADPPVIRERLSRRHGGDREALEWHLNRAPELDAVLDAQGVDDFSIDVSTATVADAALEIVRALGWSTREAGPSSRGDGCP